MNGLRTARVLVIDDNEKEAWPVLQVLWNLGIGAIYFNADPDKIARKFEGIRMVFLDMDLLGVGSGEEKKLIGHTVSTMKRILAPNCTPLLIVIWTKYESLRLAFETALKNALPDVNPHFLLLPKPPTANSDEVEYVEREIAEILKKNSPLDLLWYWEQCVHDAATETTAVLSQLVDSPSGNGWNRELLKVLAALASESGGANVRNNSSVVKALFAALNPVHEDRLDRLPVKVDTTSESAERLLQIVELRRQHCWSLVLEQQSTLNRMLLLAAANKGEHHLCPGNVYFQVGWKGKSQFPIGRSVVSKNAFVQDCLNLGKLEGKDRKKSSILASL